MAEQKRLHLPCLTGTQRVSTALGGQALMEGHVAPCLWRSHLLGREWVLQIYVLRAWHHATVLENVWNELLNCATV